MALLLQQCSCLSSCCSSSTSSIARTLQPQCAGFRAAKSQLRSSVVVVCCASSARNSSSADVVLPREETGQQVFKDETNGVVCYSDENGDVTCEGWDEGPHFQPDPQQPTLRRRRRFTPSGIAVRSRSDDGAGNFENVKGRMGDSLGEVANESLESSEL